MGFFRWFTGAIGWMITGSPLGALLGYVIGALFEIDTPSSTSSSTYSGGSGRAYGNGATENAAQAARDNFIFSLLVLTAHMIKADGKIMHSEMEYVRRFFRQNFGEQAAQEANQILLSLFQQNYDLEACGNQMAQHMSYSERLQLLYFLADIAKADGKVDTMEIQMLRRIAAALRMPQNEADSMLGLGGSSLDDAYTVLEVASSATDAEVRKAYKALVLKNHPDKVASLGEDVRKAAEEKLKRINEAYDRICKERGMK